MPSFIDVAEYLSKFGFEAMAFEQPTPTAPAAAAVIGCHVEEIAKTILVTVGSDLVVVVTSGDARINNSLLKSATCLSGKVRMLPNDQVQDVCGYPPGGVCPFLLPSSLRILLDQSLRRFEKVYPAAGTPASGVAVPVSQLSEMTGGQWVDVCRLAEVSGSC